MTLDAIVSLCKRRGFVYPTSSIYGGLANSYDYGPLGVEMLRNIREYWWKTFIHDRDDMVGLDSQILLHPRTWEASGHVSSFNDPLVEDKITHKRYRADHLIEAWDKKHHVLQEPVEEMTIEEMGVFITEHAIKSPDGNDITPPKQFNQLFESHLGTVAGDKSTVYLRGETAQGIFTNFKNIVDSTRVQLPFGIGQIGRSFRNEITTGQFIFRTIELEQAEIEYFFDPSKTSWDSLLEGWKHDMWSFVTSLGVSKKNLRWRRHTDKERSHYSKDTYDLDYTFPFGVKELWGVAYRTDYDLKQHMQYSGVDLTYFDGSKKIVPHVIEPALGLNRAFLMLLCEHYHEEEGRTWLSLPLHIAPYQVAVFPLVANKENLTKKAREVYMQLKKKFHTYWDDRGNIGKRYRYQDEIGTPWCVTIDFQTLDDATVTVRHRDSMTQERVAINELVVYCNTYEQK